MRRVIFYGILIFIFSIGIGFFYGSIWRVNHMDTSYENQTIEENIIATASIAEEKVSQDAKFALKKYYKACGHFEEKYSELPKEIINLTKNEIRKNYPDWNIEKFSSNEVILEKDVDEMCDEHFILKLGENNIEVYRNLNSGVPKLYKETDISRNYLTSADIEKLEEGIYIYGKSNLNLAIEDFE